MGETNLPHDIYCISSIMVNHHLGWSSASCTFLGTVVIDKGKKKNMIDTLVTQKNIGYGLRVD